MYFGYNPRQCFEASSSATSLKAIKMRVESAIKDAARGNLMQLFLDCQKGDATISNTIFQIFPTNTDTDTNTNRLLSHCQYEPVSRWALNLLLRDYKAGKAHEAAAFYNSLSGIYRAASFRGNLFEQQVFNYLDSISTGYRFTIRGLADSDQTSWTYHGSIRYITFQESTVTTEISKAFQDRKPRHLVPLAHNFPTMDSIFYDPNDPVAVITCIQITINMDHAIAVKGLQLLQKWFKPGSPLKDLRPTNAKPWRFLFVVPTDVARTFKLQKLKDDTPTNVWARKVHQYVLGLEERTVFRDGSDSSTGEQKVHC